MRQGCPLSPLLYVITIEVLAVCLRTSPKLTGITLPNSLEEFRSLGYANVAATTDESIAEVFQIYGTYERAFGAKLNRGKSKGLWAGSWKARTDAPHGLRWAKQLPLLGATFSVGDYTIPTWEPAVVKLEKRLTAWFLLPRGANGNHFLFILYFLLLIYSHGLRFYLHSFAI